MRSDRQTLDKQTLDKQTLDKQTLDKQTLDKQTLDKSFGEVRLTLELELFDTTQSPNTM
jgi:hypothetical protein